MAEKSGYKVILAGLLAVILLAQGIATMPVNAQEVEVEPASVNTDPDTWYTTVAGNLDSDTYDLYPYKNDASLKIGFSRFGEMINSVENTRVGLEYRNQDTFAPPAGNSFPSDIPPSSWLQGWLINITYNNPTAGLRNVWAMAQHADTVDLGKNWLRVDDDYEDNFGVAVSGGGITGSNTLLSNDAEAFEDPADDGCLISTTDITDIDCSVGLNGGRKTNGTAVSGPIEVLYDGPRRFVAVTHTTIYDFFQGNNDTKALVDVVFTIDFNKVTKEVNVIKDVKMAEQAKFTIAPLDIEVPDIDYGSSEDGKYSEDSTEIVSIEGMVVSFSNRGEFDLQSNFDENDYESFVHFYTYGASHTDDSDNAILPTKYDNQYTLLRTMPPQSSVEGSAPLSAWGGEPADPSVPIPVDGRTYGTYDVAQIISKDIANNLGDFVAWAAFWPSLSDWDVDGGRTGLWWQSLEANDPHRIDTTDEPFRSPYIIGEWDFVLASQAEFFDPDNTIDGDELEADIMFRGVSQYGLTDRHDELVEASSISDFPTLDCNSIIDDVPFGRGSDENATSSIGNVLDQEVAYYLSMKFCPWDLRDATNKDSQRHIIVENIEDDDTTIADLFLEIQGVPVLADNLVGITNDGGDGDIVGDTTIEGEEWKQYGTFAERVILYQANTTETQLLQRGVDYNITDDANDGSFDDNALIDFTPDLLLNEGDRLEIYFSVNIGAYEWTAVGRDSAVVDSAAASMVTAGFNSINSIYTTWAALDMQDTIHLTPQFLHKKYGAGDARGDYHYDHAGDDHRSALKKYWSTTVPIASSNIISVGGPGANLVSEYFNEFMPVIYRGQFFGIADLLLVPSWDALGNGNEKPARIDGLTTQDTQTNLDSVKYNITDNIPPQIIPTNEQDYGWAVIATYMDINGTVGFNVWGATGNDSFWAAQAFQNGLNMTVHYKPTPVILYKEIAEDEDENGPSSNDDLVSSTLIELGGGENSIAEWLMNEEIAGVTVLVLWIDYSNTSADGGYHPTITIVEEVGIISETPQHDP
ncbi:MAG: hypothetical protein KatS3mg003_1909 [Candidatus Nitrosocaldaceae archaeon]|nr:MAG: hypothetical protein KatS3mg003_1909 [Candidatus Nitrosocaldaceae archaeon]